VVARNDIFWADLGPPSGRRPVSILTGDTAIPHLNKVTCAPITRTMRGIPSEVEVGQVHGLSEQAVISCDNVITVAKADLDSEPVGRLDPGSRAVLDRALRYSLDIIY
jgi:mRNA interferase MazF